VLAIVGVTITLYATSNQKSQSYSSARVEATSFAENGLNLGITALENAVDPGDLSSLPTAANPTVDTSFGDGTVSWWGSYDATTATWTITGQGAVRNPSATGTITHTASEQAVVTYNPLWHYWYSDGGNGCTTITNNVVISQPLYVNGDLCLDKNAVVNSPTLQVNGTVTLVNHGSVGQSGSPISQANISDGCATNSGGPYTKPCTLSQGVNANSITTNGGTLTKPALGLSYWYQRASPGPVHPCDSGSMPGGFDTDTTLNRSRPTFTLTPNSSYSCSTSTGGHLIWNAPAKTLSISGTIFFDGNITLTSGTYSGRGTIFSSGTISIAGNNDFCGISSCDGTWNPTANLIVFVAGSSTDTYGFTLSNNGVYQAATYVVDDYQQINNSVNYGPVMARSLDLENNAQASIPVNSFPEGTPGAIVTLVPVSFRGD
jgi:hypothetical protein